MRPPFTSIKKTNIRWDSDTNSAVRYDFDTNQDVPFVGGGGGFTPTDITVSSPSTEIDFNDYNFQSVYLDESTVFTLSNGGIGKYTLFLIQPFGGGSIFSFTNVLWENGVAPDFITSSNAINIVEIIFDGTYYYGSAKTGFA